MWSALILLTVLSFGVVIYIGQKIYIQAPPIPEQVVTNDNQILFTKQDINKGQAIWQSIGGQELGTSGDMVLILHPIGLQIGYTEKQSIF